MALPFEALGPFKTALKQFFSTQEWSPADADTLSDLVTPHVADGWWEHQLDPELRMLHGIHQGSYVMWVTGVAETAASVFDRVFSGPVRPEPTPHPRKVKFTLGGVAAPGTWYRRGEETDDARVERLFEEADITDVMIAGHFVTVGLSRSSSWEDRLDDVLGLVTELFPHGTIGEAPLTREELIVEGRHTNVVAGPEELHLLHPDEHAARAILLDALDAPDPRIRRVAVAILAESEDQAVRLDALRRGWADSSRVVRRTTVDAAADDPDDMLRPLFEGALASHDAWIRWKAVRALGELGTEATRWAIEPLVEDPDFQVRFEVAKVLREI